MRKSWILAVSLLALAPAVLAQEGSAPEETARDDRPEIRVLQHPYDLASFYRNERSEGTWAGLPLDERYPIASYYRGRTAANGYSRFWTTGYRPRRSVGILASVDYRQRIGENGDLFLLAPTFLAPVGPLTSIFFEAR